MSREIKFRAWGGDYYKMCDVLVIAFDTKDAYIKYFGEALQDYIEEYVPLEKLDLLQFTGIKDKNRKEIYDADIVKVRKARGITVDYDFFEMTGQIFYHNGSYYIGGQDVLLSSMKPIDIEVIGNIFENLDNPELLEKALIMTS